jgi:hypothetical protein
MNTKITDLPLKTAPLGSGDLFEVSEDQGAGAFVSKKITGSQFVGPQGPQGPQGVAGPVGPAGLNWQGSWVSGNSYAVDDAVGYAGASYFCILATSGTTNPLTDTTHWALLAAQGSTGPQGPQGIQGIPGSPGSASPSYGQITANTGIISASIGNEQITIAGSNGINTFATNSSPDSLLIKGTFMYEIGQYVPSFGGIVVHRWASISSLGVPSTQTTNPVQNYIIMALADISSGITWGLNGTNVSNCESTWDGKTNTAAIVSIPGSGGFAASICDASTDNGQTDWYLPAIDELSMIWQNRFLINLNVGVTPGFNSLVIASYWSSTELNANDAWAFSFGNGYPNFINKNSSTYVRAVRRVSFV